VCDGWGSAVSDGSSGWGSAVSDGSSGWGSAVGVVHRGGDRRSAWCNGVRRGGERGIIGVRRGGERWIIGVRIGGQRGIIGVGRGGGRGATGCVEAPRGYATRRPHVDTWGSDRTVGRERCGAAGCLKGLTPRAALSLSVAPTYVEESDAPRCFALLGVAKPHDMLNAAWGVSPRRAAPQPHLAPNPRCSVSPMCQHGDGGVRPPDASLRTPMHNADRRFAPRCTTLTADSHPDDPTLTADSHPDDPSLTADLHPDAQRSPPIPTPMIQRPPPIRTPMIRR
jgi:hypothetical protein